MASDSTSAPDAVDQATLGLSDLDCTRAIFSNAAAPTAFDGKISRQNFSPPPYTRTTISRQYFSPPPYTLATGAICLAPFYKPVRFPCEAGSECTHVFCRPCVARCLSSSDACPLCRARAAPGSSFFFAHQTARALPVEADVEAEVATRLPAAAAAHARRAAAEAALAARTVPLMLYRPSDVTLKRMGGSLRAGQEAKMEVTEPRHLWMLARALADPQHKFGVLLSETEERGAQGCVATLKVKEWGFKPASIREWMFKIGSSFLRKRSAPLTFVVGPAFELVEPPDYEFLDHVVSAAFGPMLEAGAQLDPLPVANVLVQETSVFGN